MNAYNVALGKVLFGEGFGIGVCTCFFKGDSGSLLTISNDRFEVATDSLHLCMHGHKRMSDCYVAPKIVRKRARRRAR